MFAVADRQRTNMCFFVFLQQKWNY